jgi:eukaryotic-like serine/threonine-protein kinase
LTITSGTRLGSYEIRAQLGAGRMGEVYLGRDTELKRKVAIKILPSDVATNQDRMRRFAQEAKAAAALNYPNIAHIYKITKPDGVNFIAIEFADGEALRDRMHRETEISKFCSSTYSRLPREAKAQASGIVHRDLKLLRRVGLPQ